MEFRSPLRISTFALVAAMILPAITPAESGEPHGNIVSAYARSDQGPGKMKLLPGYIAGLPKGSTCIDTECGYIWNPQGLTINYDVGGMAGVALQPEPRGEYAWYGEANINGELVRYAVSAEATPGIIVSFPASSANFNAELRGESEIHTVFKMLLTYQGKGYTPDPKGVIDVRFANRDGTPLAGVKVSLQQSSPPGARTARTDDKGHSLFLEVLPGRHELAVAAEGRCAFAARRWKINTEPAEILLRSFTVVCR